MPECQKKVKNGVLDQYSAEAAERFDILVFFHNQEKCRGLKGLSVTTFLSNGIAASPLKTQTICCVFFLSSSSFPVKFARFPTKACPPTGDTRDRITTFNTMCRLIMASIRAKLLFVR